MLPGNSPVFIRASRLHDELFARELECARQVFADKGPHQCALNVIGEGVSAFVDLICAKGGLVAALRILLGAALVPACGFRSITWTDMWPSRVKTSSPVESAL